MTSDQIPKNADATLWDVLPRAVQHDLAASGYDAPWFRAHPPEIRLTALNVYRKLHHLDLWRFVGQASSVSVGNLEYICTDVAAFKSELRARRAMTSPRRAHHRWSSRELCAHASLHLKHFPGWPRDKVQAHIDPYGLEPVWLKGIVPIVPLRQLLTHVWHYHGYTDVWTIRDQLDAARCGFEVRLDD